MIRRANWARIHENMSLYDGVWRNEALCVRSFAESHHNRRMDTLPVVREQLFSENQSPEDIPKNELSRNVEQLR